MGISWMYPTTHSQWQVCLVEFCLSLMYRPLNNSLEFFSNNSDFILFFSFFFFFFFWRFSFFPFTVKALFFGFSCSDHFYFHGLAKCLPNSDCDLSHGWKIWSEMDLSSSRVRPQTRVERFALTLFLYEVIHTWGGRKRCTFVYVCLVLNIQSLTRLFFMSQVLFLLIFWTFQYKHTFL